MGLGGRRRLNDPIQAINYGRGDYDPKSRVLKVSTSSDSLYAFEASNSTWDGTSWSISGASAFRAAAFSQLVHHIYLNEVTSQRLRVLLCMRYSMATFI